MAVFIVGYIIYNIKNKTAMSKIKRNNICVPSFQTIEGFRNPRIDMSGSKLKDRETGVQGEARMILSKKLKNPWVINMIASVVAKMKSSDKFKEQSLHLCVATALSAYNAENKTWQF